MSLKVMTPPSFWAALRVGLQCLDPSARWRRRCAGARAGAGLTTKSKAPLRVRFDTTVSMPPCAPLVTITGMSMLTLAHCFQHADADRGFGHCEIEVRSPAMSRRWRCSRARRGQPRRHRRAPPLVAEFLQRACSRRRCTGSSSTMRMEPAMRDRYLRACSPGAVAGDWINLAEAPK